jgi:hypothetical protein
MAVILDQRLSASPVKIRLPREEVDLVQTLHSDLGGPEKAKITYSLDGRTAVFFDTPAGRTKEIVIDVTVPADPTQRTDPVTLVEQGTTAMAEVEIDQLIEAETRVFDSVTLEVVK